MIQCSKIVPCVLIKPFNPAEIKGYGVVAYPREKLLQTLEQMAALTKSQILPNVLVSQDEFETLMHRTHTYNSEYEALSELAKNNNGMYDRNVADLLVELKAASKEEDEQYAPVEVSGIIEFLKSFKNSDNENKEKILNFITEFPDKTNAARIMNDLGRFSNYNEEIKNKTLDLTIQLHNQFGEQIEMLGSPDITSGTKMLRQFVRRAEKGRELERLNKISNVIENTDDIRPLIDLINLIEDVDQKDWNAANELVDRFLDLGILPTKGIVNEFITMSQICTMGAHGFFLSKNADINGAERFFEIMKPLTDLKLKNIYVDQYAFDEIIQAEDKTFLNSIIEKVKAENQSQEVKKLVICENSLNPSEFSFNTYTNSEFRKYIYDKNTKSFISEEILKGDDTIAELVSDDKKLKKNIQQSFHHYNGFLSETVTRYDKNEHIKNRDFTTISNVPGQLDVYRQTSTGKIQVLSKAFKDPITGEKKIKRHLGSPNKTKTAVNYTENLNGNYSYSYKIKDKSGHYLMDTNRTCRVIDENHLFYNLNGTKYDVLRQNNTLIIIKSGEHPVIIELDKVVPSGNKKIIEALTRIPADELINIKRLNIRFKVTSDVENAGAITNSVFDRVAAQMLGENLFNDIELGDNLADSLAVILHEIGHVKNLKITKEEWKKILAIYNKELQAYRKSSTLTEARMLSYLIDTEHYLNEHGKGAIEEALSDINYIIKIPADNNVGGDFVIRGIKFQESFPETIACYNKILESKVY